MSRLVVVGGGPAGLAAAVECRRRGVRDVVVLEREAVAGGVPRHCDHTGFGLRDLHRMLRGPAYAARWVERAVRAGVEIRPSASVVEWKAPSSLGVTSPRGLETLAADAVVLATGCRERPRSARLVPGTRPAGIFTTGSLQQLVHLRRARVGRRAVVVGAEHVSFSAALTLAEAGCETVAMVTEHPTHQTYAPLAWLAAGRRGVPVVTGRRVAEVHGRARVEGVTLDDGRTLACDTIVLTGEWIAVHELARLAGLAIDEGTRGPAVDQLGRTSMPGVFAAGNLVHAAETADVAALGGRATAAAVSAFLGEGAWPATRVPVVCESPLRWVWPQSIDPAARVPRRFLLRTSELLTNVALEARQSDRVLWRRRYRVLVPNRSISAPAAWSRRVHAGSRPIRWSLA